MANLFSGISDFLSGGQMSTALDRLARSSDAIYGVQTPDLTQLIPQLKLQVQQGTMTPAEAGAALAQVQGSMTPAQAQAFLQSDSEFNNVQSDQGSIQGQREALNKLAQIGENNGMTEADRAQLAATMNQTNANAAQQRAAQLQQLQMQGNAGTGAELAARLSGVQGGANANAAAGAEVAKAAQARALQAIQAGLAGNANLNSQMFDQAAKKAAAQDVVNQYNAQARNTIGLQNAANQQAANQQNFQTANQMALANQQAQQAANEANAARAQQAGLTNFQTANTIAGVNTGIQNQQAQLPYNAAQANFTNQLNKATAGSTADYRAGSVMADIAKTQMGNTTGMLDALGNVLGSSGFGGLVKDASGAIGKWVAGKWQAATADEVAAAGGAQNIPIDQSPYGGGGDYSGYTTGSDSNYTGGDTGSADTGDSSWWDDISDWFSDEKLKTNKKQMSDSDIDKIMAHMTAYKYRYKGPKTNPTQVGIMAQDMPKNSTVNTPAGKMVQGPQALNQALAVLANQHERIRKLEGKK